MEIKIEKANKNYIIQIDNNSSYCNLADLENLKTHLDYFIQNDKVTSISIKIGDDE